MICQATHQHAKENNKHLKSFEKKTLSNHI